MLARLRRWIKDPNYVLAVVGLVGFAIDMFIKPISNAGLILLAVACAPWLTRLIKSGKVAGFEFVLAPTAPAGETAARLAEETDIAPQDDLASVTPAHVATGEQAADVAAEGGQRKIDPATLLAAEAIPGSGGKGFGKSQRLAFTYLLEGLVLQELQQQLDGVLQREVRLKTHAGGSRTLDGLIIRGREAVAIEVKIFRASVPLSIITQAIDYMTASLEPIKTLGFDNSRAIVAIVTQNPEMTPEKWSDVEAEISLPLGVQLRFFSAHVLMRKYGFDI